MDEKTPTIIEFEGEMPRTVYTIGTKNIKLPLFMNALLFYQVHAVIDIRKPDKTKTDEEYEETNLKNLLETYKIHYRKYPKLTTINDRQNKTQEILENLEKAIQTGYWICFLGKDQYPENCRRLTVYGEHFHQKGYRVIHLIPKENIINPKTNKLIEKWKYYQYHEEAKLHKHKTN